MTLRRILLAIFVLAFTPATSGWAAPDETEHVKAELVAENQSFKGGDVDNWVALSLTPDEGWHVYWRNPGDSGIPTKIEWKLPAGVTAGEIQWPYPHKQSLAELTNYGYDGQTLHLVPLRVPADATSVAVDAKAKWLVCKDVCIPGEIGLHLAMPVAKTDPQPDPKWTAAFAQARAHVPTPEPGWAAQYAVADGTFSLDLQGAKFVAGSDIEFFPFPNDLVNHAAPQRIAIDEDNGLRLSQATSAYFVEAPKELGGVLVVHEKGGATKAYQIDAHPGEAQAVPAESAAVVGPAPVEDKPGAATGAAAAPEASLDITLLGAIAAAFLGGLILNLLPCVFPVLAMKALSLMGARGETAADNRRHALAYTAGVVGSFVAVGVLLMVLRAGGAQLGWGFQLQSPLFVYALLVIVFAMGLSLSGAIQVGASWMGAGQSLASRPGLAGSFFTGVFAVVVASPCVAPFMAPAVGFALAQPGPGAVLIFAALGIGLALPFLLLGFAPRLAALLPRPGAWMETFKQAMAFPMYLTAIWLLYVIGGLTSREGMGLALVGIVLVAFALWLSGRAERGWFSRALGGVALAAAVALAFHPLMALSTRPAASGAAAAASDWEPYSDARFAALRAQGRSVFVDFTADWCLTCKLNERGALRSAAVQGLFRDRDVALLQGDWTRPDPEITAVLKRYGRSGVPLYLASDRGADPAVLPQVLTPAALAAAFPATVAEAP